MLMAPAIAQISSGHGTIVTVPVVVQSGTYGSSVFIHNPNGVSVFVNAYYDGADGSATVGRVICSTVNIPAGNTFQRSLTQVCPGLNPGSNFGRLTFWEGDAANQPFSVYSRVETFSGNGFSIEGYPIGVLTGSSGNSWVNGLRRQAAAPGYQTNCFIGALNEAVGVQWSLQTSTGATLGATQQVNLGANQFVRLLDVFAAAGAPAGDYSNVRARFSENGTGEPGFVAFCTVQNNTSFDADFRIAKDQSPADQGRRFTASARDGVTLSQSLVLTDNQDDIFQAFWQHPDWARCIISTNTGTLANYEVRVKNPAGVVVAGGSDVTDTGEFFLGERSIVNGGVNGIWRIEVGHAILGVTPEPYFLNCTTGNGGSEPLRVGSQADAF
jgi:hypothetical protein